MKKKADRQMQSLSLLLSLFPFAIGERAAFVVREKKEG